MPGSCLGCGKDAVTAELHAGDSSRGTCERDEEGVALGVYFNSAVQRECLAEHVPVLSQHVRIPVPEFKHTSGVRLLD